MKTFESIMALLGRKLWIGVWIVGVMIFLSYYARIEYMPDFDVSSLSFLLLAAAVVGTLFVASIGIIVLLPALVWWWTVLGRKEYKAFWFGWENSKSLAWWFGYPFVPTLVAGFTAFYMYFLLQLPSICAFVVFAVGVLISIVWLWIGLKKNGIAGGWFKIKYVLCWTFSWSTFILPFLFIALIVFKHAKVDFPEAEQPMQLFYLGILLVLAVMASLLALQPFPAFRNFPAKLRPVAQFAVVGGFFTLVLFLVPGTGDVLPKAVMRALGIGGDIPVGVIFSTEGRLAASALGIASEGSGDNARSASLLLRSRLGTEYVFAQEGSQFQYVFPKAAVSGIRRKDDNSRQSSSEPNATDRTPSPSSLPLEREEQRIYLY